MENRGDEWHALTAKRVGEAVAHRRRQLGLTVQNVADRCRDIGAPIHRTTITKIENGRARFDLGELIVLSAALNTSPVVLVFPGPYDSQVKLFPDVEVSQLHAAQWFSADPYDLQDLEWSHATRSLVLWRDLDNVRAMRTSLMNKPDFNADQHADQIAFYDSRIRRLQQDIAREANHA